MSVTPSPIGGFAGQFFDNNGNPLSGGKIFTYAAGTTTPQAAYTSASGVTPHSNPIVLDSAGRVPGGEIWLTDGLVYKFVIETATSILIGTYDNITGVNSNFVNYTVQEEVQTATAGQTVFNLTTINYTPGTNSLSVYIDGVNQYVGDSYLETDSDTVTFTAGLHVGAEVKFTTAIQTTSGAVNADIVAYDPPFTGGVATTVETKLAQTVSVKDFGAVGDGVADDTAAVQAAVDALISSGGTLYFPAGIYSVSTAITLCSNIVIAGAGVEATKLTVIGTGVNNIFYALNQRNIKISDLWFYGNSQANASGNGLAVYINHNGSATQQGGNIRIENCRFDNFKGDYWVYVVNDNTTYAVSGIYITNNYFNSLPGNARDGTTPAVPSACVSIQGSTAGGMATDIVVSSNAANCEHIKSFLLLWQGCDRAVVEGNIVTDAGLGAAIQDDAGAYAIMVYDSSGLNVPRKVVIDGNIISGVRSCGLYAAAAEELLISNNKISDQTDTVDTTLPKGGIVLNSCTDIQMVGNQLSSIASSAIHWQPGAAPDANIFISGNAISSAARGIKFVSFLFNSRNLNVTGNTVVDCLYGIEIQTIGNTVEIGGVSIADNHILSTVASSYGINLRSDDGFFRVSNAKISGNYVKTDSYGIYWRGAGPTVVSDNMFVGPFSTRALDLQNATNLSISANSFFDQTSGGECLFTAGAEGSMRENSFENCSTSRLIVVSGGTDMGRATPTWTPTGRGPFVQNIAAVETGTAASKYIVSGWYYDGTAWLQSRALTGN